MQQFRSYRLVHSQTTSKVLTQLILSFNFNPYSHVSIHRLRLHKLHKLHKLHFRLKQVMFYSRAGERIPLLNRCPLQGQLRMRISIPSSSNIPTSYRFPGDQISSMCRLGFHQVDHWVLWSTSLSS